MDVVRDLGLLALGTRLRRLGTRLQEQCQAMLDEGGLELPAAQLPLLEALERQGPLRVGEIGQALGLSQPAVTRQLGLLEAGAYLRSVAAAEDARVRVIELAPKGRRLLARARRELWPAIEAAVADAVHGDLLAQLDALEAALQELPLARRAARRKARARA